MDKELLAKEILAKHNLSGFQPEKNKPADLTNRFAELDAIASGSPLQQEKQDGLLKTIAKDAAGTLVVKPVARATEAATRVFAPNSTAAEGFRALADEGEGQTIAGIDIASQKALGEGGGRQIAGDVLKTASYLFPYGKAAKAAGTVASGVVGATAGKIAGNVAAGATGGYLADAGFGLEDDTQSVGDALKPGVGTALGAAIPLAGPVVRATGRATAKTGSKLVEAVIPSNIREAKLLQTYKANNPFLKRVNDVLSGTEKAPTTAAQTVTRKGLFGTKSGIGIQATRAQKSLWDDVISPRLKASEQAVDLPGFFAKVEQDIIENTPELARQKSLLKALNSYRNDYAGIDVVSLEKLQKLKEGWAEFVPEKFYKGENIAGAANQVRGLLSSESRQTIYSQLGDDVRQAYLDYGNLAGIKKMGQTSMTGQKLKGGTGGLISEIFSQTVTPIGTTAGRAIYKIGKGIEFIGDIGAKNLGEVLGISPKNFKFPGDKAVDDITKRLKGLGDTPIEPSFKKGGTKNPIKRFLEKNDINPQGGYIGGKPQKSSRQPIKSSVSASSNSTKLAQEAKKFKTADEFIGSHKTGNELDVNTIGTKTGKPVRLRSYHGTNADFKDFVLQKDGVRYSGDGHYFTPEKESASMFGKNTKEVILDLKNPYVKYLPEGNTDQQFFELSKEIQEKGHDGIIVRMTDTSTGEWTDSKGIFHPEGELESDWINEIVVFDTKAIKTRSQIQDIWKKANKAK